MDLSIFHNRTQVGTVRSVEGGLSFRYQESYLANPASYPLSLSLPLQEAPLPIRQTERFFGGLLPEGDERIRAARYLKVSSASTAQLLAALAGDCVGNLTVLRPDADLDALIGASSYEPLSRRDFQEIISNNPDVITRISAENRLSIPGAQPKIGLYTVDSKIDTVIGDDQKWYIPRGLFASTHIIKPSLRLYQNTSLNEYFCNQLANSAGIEVAKSWLINSGGNAVVISERFDRQATHEGFIERLCQEDFCQALSYSPLSKYQIDGGPGFSRILDTLRFEMSNPPQDIQRFLRVFLFNYLIGNCDAHARNYSIRRTLDGRLGLAPAYDLVSTTFYPDLSTNVAIGVNNVYALERIRRNDFETMCASNDVSWALFQRIAAEVAEGCISGLGKVQEKLAERGFENDALRLREHLESGVSKRAETLV
ncbi:MAG: HipA domain-containing protein [Coriobacteriales bacterium]|jgi:serine/threonine-protein kinase HipA|nr:HipA domain-containing protein [Coriobacteriales bacterium]